MGWCALFVALQKVGPSISCAASMGARPQCQSCVSFEINFHTQSLESLEQRQPEVAVDASYGRGDISALESHNNKNSNGCFSVFERLEPVDVFKRLGPRYVFERIGPGPGASDFKRRGFFRYGKSRKGPRGRKGKWPVPSRGPPCNFNATTSQARGGDALVLRSRGSYDLVVTASDPIRIRALGADLLRLVMTTGVAIEISGDLVGVPSGGGSGRKDWDVAHVPNSATGWLVF